MSLATNMTYCQGVSVVRRLLRFNPLGFFIGLFVIGIMYATVVFLIWLAFGSDAAPHPG